jgi:hypothetical protein
MVGAAEEAAHKNGGAQVNRGGRPPTELDVLLEALFYRLRNAGPWRDLPEHFGPRLAQPLGQRGPLGQDHGGVCAQAALQQKTLPHAIQDRELLLPTEALGLHCHAPRQTRPELPIPHPLRRCH